MDITEMIGKIGELEDPNYGRVYIEFGGFSDSRTVLYHEGHWCFDDSKHSKYYTCSSFTEALECLVNPPGEDEWVENIEKYYGAVNPAVTLPRGEHP